MTEEKIAQKRKITESQMCYERDELRANET